MNTDRPEKACRYFASGYNCAQSVLLAFCDVCGLGEDTAKRLSSSFGGGMGRMREICGACSSMFMVAGLLYGADTELDHELKTAHYKRIQLLAGKFKERFQTINCSELLKGLAVAKDPEPEKRTEEYYKVRPCARYVRAAAEILDEYIAENPSPFAFPTE